jgi:CheY-like chemotaxis protein
MESTEKTNIARAPRILVADDEQWFVRPLVDALEFEGYTVERSRTGSETLAIVAEASTRPNLLILDFMMDPGELSGGDGVGTRTGAIVLEKIRTELNLAPKLLPAICFTILNDERLQEFAKQFGAQFFSKTDFKMAEVLATVRQKISASGK